MNRLIEDLRFCIGAFFAIVGVLLAGQGLITGPAENGINLNLYTGLVFVIFGGACLFVSMFGIERAKKKRKTTR